MDTAKRPEKVRVHPDQAAGLLARHSRARGSKTCQKGPRRDLKECSTESRPLESKTGPNTVDCCHNSQSEFLGKQKQVDIGIVGVGR